MLISNIKSFGDLNAKKNLQKQLLEVEANNELENQRRYADFKNPYIPAPVPQQTKTSAELRKDLSFNEQEARKNLEQFNMNYQDISSVIIWLSSNNRLIDFNANFKGIKKDIEQNYNPKLISPQWFENYLEKYFEEVDVNYGRKMVSGIVELPLATNFEELLKIIPSEDDIDRFKNLLINLNEEYSTININEILNYLLIYQSILIDRNMEKILLQLNQKDRNTFIKRYITLLNKMNFISINELDEYTALINKYMRTGIENIRPILNRLLKQLYNISNNKDLTDIDKLFNNLSKNIKEIPNIDSSLLDKKKEKIEF